VGENRRETKRCRWEPLRRSRDPHLHLHPGSQEWRRKRGELRDTAAEREKRRPQRGVAGRAVTGNTCPALSSDCVGVEHAQSRYVRVALEEHEDVAERSAQVVFRYKQSGAAATSGEWSGGCNNNNNNNHSNHKAVIE
jgi:hypothetical protein